MIIHFVAIIICGTCMSTIDKIHRIKDRPKLFKQESIDKLFLFLEKYECRKKGYKSIQLLWGRLLNLGNNKFILIA